MCNDRIMRYLRKEEKLHELDELSATLSVEFITFVGEIFLNYNFRYIEKRRFKEYTIAAHGVVTQDRYCCHPFFNEGPVVFVQMLGDSSL